MTDLHYTRLHSQANTPQLPLCKEENWSLCWIIEKENVQSFETGEKIDFSA
jgi:hypothetical protein